MKKKEYIQPEVQVVLLSTIQQMLAGSVTNVVTDGLPEEELVLPGTDVPGTPWVDAM